jgi:hypothetical protein
MIAFGPLREFSIRQNGPTEAPASTRVVPSARAQTSNANVAAPSAAAASAQRFDVKVAVDAYLARIPADQRARSDAYFEGGYWLELWDFLLGVAISIFLLQSRLSARLRDWAAKNELELQKAKALDEDKLAELAISDENVAVQFAVNQAKHREYRALATYLHRGMNHNDAVAAYWLDHPQQQAAD